MHCIIKICRVRWTFRMRVQQQHGCQLAHHNTLDLQQRIRNVAGKSSDPTRTPWTQMENKGPTRTAQNSIERRQHLVLQPDNQTASIFQKLRKTATMGCHDPRLVEGTFNEEEGTGGIVFPCWQDNYSVTWGQFVQTRRRTLRKSDWTYSLNPVFVNGQLKWTWSSFYVAQHVRGLSDKQQQALQ